MLISEYIKFLERIREHHGDLDVCVKQWDVDTFTGYTTSYYEEASPPDMIELSDEKKIVRL